MMNQPLLRSIIQKFVQILSNVRKQLNAIDPKRLNEELLGPINDEFELGRWSTKFLSEDETIWRVDKLLQEGADVNCKTSNGYTLLMFAARKNYEKLVDFLIERKADVNTQNNFGWTAIMFAAETENPKIIEKFIKAGADVNLNTDLGFTVLMKASKSGSVKVVQALLDAGANPNHQDRFGVTALMKALQKGQLDNVKALLESGADPTIENCFDQTALSVAKDDRAVGIILAWQERRQLQKSISPISERQVVDLAIGL